jgi:hypothetical protein
MGTATKDSRPTTTTHLDDAAAIEELRRAVQELKRQ